MYPDKYGAIWDKYEVMCNKQLGFIRTNASQAQVKAFWDRTAQTSQGKECGGYKGPGPQKTQEPLSTALEPYVWFPKLNWYQRPKTVAGEEWGIEEPRSGHLIFVQVSLPLPTQGEYAGGLLCNQGILPR